MSCSSLLGIWRIVARSIGGSNGGRSGCWQRRQGARQWRRTRLLQRKLALPSQAEFVICDQSIFSHFRRFRLQGRWHLLYTALHRAERERVGRNPDPSAAIMDSQSVKTVEESAHICGYDAHKCIKGRKRHLLVDTLGLPIASYVTPADIHDTVGARKVLSGLAFFVPRLKKIWADAAYRGKELADWCQQQGAGWDLEVVEREPGTRGFSLQSHRWIVERSFAWLIRNRRLAKEYERRVQTSETLIELAMMRLLLRRLGR
jgi:putative transposase